MIAMNWPLENEVDNEEVGKYFLIQIKKKKS